MMDHEHSDAATPAGTPRQMGMAVDEHETHARADANASHYIVPGDALAYGASLGNAHCWLTTRGNGSIQDIFSTDLGTAISGAIAVRYGGTDYGLLRASAHGVTGGDRTADVQLHPLPANGGTDLGTIELHPAYQRRSFALPGDLHVRETVFVPLATGDDPAVAYCQVRVDNRGAGARALTVYAFGRLCGALGQDVVARYDPDLRGFIAANRSQPSAVRVFGCVGAAPIAAYDTGHDFGRVYDGLHVPTLGNEASAEGDILASLQVDLQIGPGETRALTVVLAFAHTGEEDAITTYRHAQDVDAALAGTISNVTRVTGVSHVLTPDRTINQGALWSKVNMLRVMARYPQGPACTNEPGASSNVVGRDAAWFVYGNDHFLPAFSRALLDTFAAKQYPDGKIPEYYSALNGRVEDYGLNINDDTPLFILAVNHHYRATGDTAWLRTVYPAVARAARYIVTQEDGRGLVFCSARDPRGNVWAIASWRNVIPEYTLNGAVTEINAECAAALRAAGHLAENLDLPEAEAREFFDASAALRTAMDTHLINPRNGLYYLTIDADGIAQTDVTGDEIFPVMFRVCDDETGFRIISRLSHPDFWTSGGLRTVSADDVRYDPARFVGLLGGVWLGLTWWYAFAAARYRPDLMVRALATSFAHYASDPKNNTTVPGQFSEWFDGESLANRGMRLSPWEPPRFLWAVVEGVCGVVLGPDKPRINPLVPAHWRWVGLRRLPYHSGEISFFATREHRDDQASAFDLYATAEVATEHTLAVYDEDVTERVRVLTPTVCHLALRRRGEIVVLLGRVGADTGVVPVEVGDLLAAETTYTVHLYDSESYTWRGGDTATGAALSTFAVSLEGGGFKVLKLIEV